MSLEITRATPEELPLVLQLIRELAEYERLSHAVVATLEGLRAELFGERPVAEALVARDAGEPVGFAVFFHNFSTFLLFDLCAVVNIQRHAAALDASRLQIGADSLCAAAAGGCPDHGRTLLPQP